MSINEKTLEWSPIQKKGEDWGVVVDTKLNLICGIDAKNGKRTDNIYNEHITSGEFFKIPEGGESSLVAPATISAITYNYLYF
jgi:hypothetical protein